MNRRRSLPPLNWLRAFEAAARHLSFTAAAGELNMTQSAVSQQIKSLEGHMGRALFHRRPRTLELTETGKLVYGYAEDIFRTGRELVDAVRGRPLGSPRSFRVGIADVMAKLVAFQLLLPAFDFEEQLAVECREDQPKRLFAELAIHELDLVLSDIPLGPDVDVRAYNHVMGESTTTLFAAPALARRLRKGFPQSLSGAPFLMPSVDAAIRRALDQWLEEEELRPLVVGEFEDSALLKVFGQAGRGVFPAPTIVSEQVCRQYGVRALGEVESIRDRFYAISPERRIKHPAVARIVENAKAEIFAN